MGCGPSKQSRSNNVELQARPARRPVPAGQAISGPSGGLVLIPPPYRDAQGRPIRHNSAELDRNTILSALRDMSAYLAPKQISARVITVGGAVNTVLLQSRQTTNDVDFFSEDGTAQVNLQIHEAAKDANRRRRGALGAAWFNNSTQLYMGRDRARELASAAIQQNEIVYNGLNSRGHGLQVYAASWEYALCGKMNRLTEGDERAYDLNDALEYLVRYFQKTGQRSIAAATIKQWCARWGKQVNDEVLRRLDEAFLRKYGRRCIV